VRLQVALALPMILRAISGSITKIGESKRQIALYDSSSGGLGSFMNRGNALRDKESN